MEDIRIGRNTPVVERLVTIPNTSVPLVDDDPKRTMLIIHTPPSGRLTLSIKNPVVADVGITLDNLAQSLQLRIEEHGQLVTKAWFGIHSVGGVSVAVYEGHLSLE